MKKLSHLKTLAGRIETRAHALAGKLEQACWDADDRLYSWPTRHPMLSGLARRTWNSYEQACWKADDRHYNMQKNYPFLTVCTCFATGALSIGASLALSSIILSAWGSMPQILLPLASAGAAACLIVGVSSLGASAVSIIDVLDR